MAIIVRDTAGQAWEITVNPDGTMSTTAVTTAPSGAGANTTVTIQQVVNYASVHTELMPLAGVGGYTNEPSLSIAIDALAELLSPPFAWKCNRKTMPLLVTCQNKQDYKFGGACAFSLTSSGTSVGGVGIDLASNNAITAAIGSIITVRVLEPHRFSVGDTVYLTGLTMKSGDVTMYQAVLTDNGVSTTWSNGWTVTSVSADKMSFTFVNNRFFINLTDIGGAPGITDFGWAESATMVNENETSSPRFVRYVEAARTLQPVGTVGIPDKVSIADNGDNTLTIRFSVAPGAAPFGATILYQAKAPIKASLNDNWSPITDDYAYVYRQMFLAAAFRYVGSARAEDEFKKAQMMIQKALSHDDAETSEEYIAPSESLMGGWL